MRVYQSAQKLMATTTTLTLIVVLLACGVHAARDAVQRGDINANTIDLVLDLPYEITDNGCLVTCTISLSLSHTHKRMILGGKHVCVYIYAEEDIIDVHARLLVPPHIHTRA